MLRMRNKETNDSGVLVWLAGSWHLYYSEDGTSFVKELELTDFAAEADDLSFLLDELACAEWEVIG